MLWKQLWLVLFFCKTNAVILCFNCSSTHRDWSQCGGDFVTTIFPLNTTRKNLINCTGDNAMCFVRSWSSRTRHAWIVQRGCYLPIPGDTLPRALKTPLRAMTCKQERFPDAEYNVCLCQANWCNSASSVVPTIVNVMTKLPRYFIEYLVGL